MPDFRYSSGFMRWVKKDIIDSNTMNLVCSILQTIRLQWFNPDTIVESRKGFDTRLGGLKNAQL